MFVFTDTPYSIIISAGESGFGQADFDDTDKFVSGIGAVF